MGDLHYLRVHARAADSNPVLNVNQAFETFVECQVVVDLIRYGMPQAMLDELLMRL